ncbi:MAG: glucokinase [Emcibacteraceae bacterium]|nr:glucokinase [Emcibacteraceae bacterium]
MKNPIIVSDIGGTNGRFALAEFKQGNNLPTITNIQVFACASYKYFSDMLGAYLENLEGAFPKIARFAIAGEMTPRRGNLWHFNWEIDAGELEEKFGFDSVTLLNDYEALVHAIPHFTDRELETITPFTQGQEGAPFSAFGVGSGLGGSIGVPSPVGLNVVPSEVGHISFAPKSEQEYELLKFTKNTVPHVSIETFMSGPGITRIHNFLCHLKGQNVSNLAPAEITANAINKSDEICVETIEVFFNMLGSISGDIALIQGAKSGVYIGGGIVPRIASLLNKQTFIERFTDKGPMQGYVKRIPIHIITADKPALIGAALSK